MSRAGPFEPFDRVAVLGLGLLGGSVALAARERGAGRSFAAAGRRREPLERGLAAGVVDEIGDAAAAVRGADLVVLATPVPAMAAVLSSAAPHLREGALVTDVGSVKAPLTDILPGLLPEGARFVGSHPMAGGHLTGVEHARSDLFDGAVCAVTPLPDTPKHVSERIQGFWQQLGARVVLRDPAAHDAQVAWMSHAPHVIAFAFAESLAPAPAAALSLAGTGFRDFTRIAGSDAELWGDILRANRKALAGPLDAFGQALSRLADAVERDDAEAVEQFLASARSHLARVVSVSGAGRPARDEAAPVRGRSVETGGQIPDIEAAEPAATRGVRPTTHD